MDKVIVSAGIGEHYAAGRESTRAHCAQHCPEAALMVYDDYPSGCPPQNEQQYAFKIYALDAAIRAGFRYVVWMDSAFQPIGSMAPLWETVEREGWYIAPQLEEKLGRWCSDVALDVFGIDRERAYAIPLVYSGLVALDMERAIGKQIWLDWSRLYFAGAFNGPHVNLPGVPMRPWGNKWEGHVSYDAGVQGHRHDEAALSFVLDRHGLTPQRRGFLTLESESGFIGHCVPLEAACPGA